MRLWPSKRKWVKYSWPTQFAIICGYVGILSFLIYLGVLMYPIVWVREEIVVTSNGPKRVRLDDPKIVNIRSYDLGTDVGSYVSIGNCPNAPCFEVYYRDIDINTKPPKVSLSVGGKFSGIDMPASQGIYIGIPLRKGCGFTLFAPGLKLIFEINDDRLGSIKAWGIILESDKRETGVFIEEMDCR